jgi:predicted aldo/keto reductase-like oxidoreductase
MKKITLISILSAIVLSATLVSCSGDSKSKMTMRINPHTGDKVSLLGFGCMRFPMMEDENGNRIVDQEATNILIDAAIAHGVNYFDAAPTYLSGLCEAATGVALSRHPRESFLIATKMSNGRNFSFEFAKAMYEKSFVDLQVDYIDYYLLHSVGGGNGIQTFNERFIENGVLDFLLEERKSGRIRNLGFSFHGDVAVYDHMFELGIQWDFVQIYMNYIDWKHATGRNVNAEHLYHKAVENNTPVVGMSALSGGRLAALSPLARNVLEKVDPTVTPAEWAFRWVGSFEYVLSSLSGMTHMDHLMENVRTHSPLKPLSKEGIEALAVVAEIMSTAGFINCTGCNYCVPCPFGVDIPGILLRYNEYIAERKEIDKSDPLLQQAATCRGAEVCGLCEKECPHRVGIVKALQRIDSIVNAK